MSAIKNEKDEKAIQDLQLCLKDLDSDPFDISKPFLRSLQSGVNASPVLVSDLKNALSDGKKEYFQKVKLLLQVFTGIQD